MGRKSRINKVCLKEKIIHIRCLSIRKHYFFRIGDFTQLVYLQQTIDIEFGSTETFRIFSNQVDIIWWSCFDPCPESFNFIDKEKVEAVALDRCNPTCAYKKFIKQFQMFYYHQHLKHADSYLYFEGKDRQKNNSYYPKNFSKEELCSLLAFLVSSKPLNFEQWENQDTLYKLNCHRKPDFFTKMIKTPFQEALMKGDMISVQELLQNEIDLNEQVFWKIFEVFIQSKSPDKKKIVELLIQKGLKPSRWLFMLAAKADENDIAEILANNGAIENYEGPLGKIIASHYCNQTLIEVLILKGAEINEKDDHGGKYW